MAEDGDRFMGRVAMVTGAGTSIGKAVTEVLVRYGMIVIAVDDYPDFDNLEGISDDLKSDGALGSVFPTRCDIRSVDMIRKLFTSVKNDPDLCGVDVCVHCGVVTLGEAILDGNPEAWRSMLETNVLAAAFITQETIKSMKERNVDDGHVIFMNGMSSHRLLPGNKNLHFLSITKFAGRAMLEGVRNELRMEDSHIRVSSISAGVVENDILKKLFNSDHEAAKAYLGEKKYLDVTDIASTVMYILEQPSHVQIHDVLMRSTEQIP